MTDLHLFGRSSIPLLENRSQVSSPRRIQAPLNRYNEHPSYLPLVWGKGQSLRDLRPGNRSGPIFYTRTAPTITSPHSGRAALGCHVKLLVRLQKVQVSSYGSLVLVVFNNLVIVFPINGFSTLDLVTSDNSMSVVGKNH